MNKLTMKEKVNTVKLITQPTRIDYLSRVLSVWNVPRLSVKREGQAEALHGDNKIRNVEFPLVDVIKEMQKKLLLLCP